MAIVAVRYATAVRYHGQLWHRIVFDGLAIALISLGVRITGGAASDLWLVYYVLVIAETLDSSERVFWVLGAGTLAGYAWATWPDEFTRAYWETVATRVFFLVVIAAIARRVATDDRQRQADLAALREALSVSEERRRLARELHDSIGHSLTRVILSLEVARRQCEADPESAAATIGEQATALRGAMEEMRQIVATLRTDAAPFDLPAAARALAARLGEMESLDVQVRVAEEALPLSAEKQYHLARVIQEALTNCLRHARCPSAAVEIRVETAYPEGRRVVAVVSDNGIGFDRAAAGAAHGLDGMAERLAPYGGGVSVEAAPGRGTRVIAHLPADQDAGTTAPRGHPTPMNTDEGIPNPEFRS